MMNRWLLITMAFVAGTLLGVVDSNHKSAQTKGVAVLGYRLVSSPVAYAGSSCSKGCSCPAVQCKKASSNSCSISCREDETAHCSCEAYCDNNGYVKKYQSCSCD